jgi:hypothetical protein
MPRDKEFSREVGLPQKTGGTIRLLYNDYPWKLSPDITDKEWEKFLNEPSRERLLYPRQANAMKRADTPAFRPVIAVGRWNTW